MADKGGCMGKEKNTISSFRKLSKLLIGILLASFALYLSKGFLIYISISRCNPLSLVFGLIWIGYIYIVGGLVKLKRWALSAFTTIFLLSGFIEIIIAIMGGRMEDFAEGFNHVFVWLSVIIMPIFGASEWKRRMDKKETS